jgi:hypothetical protein
MKKKRKRKKKIPSRALHNTPFTFLLEKIPIT